MKDKKENRFELVLKEGSQLTDEGVQLIFRDRETGVHYLFVHCGYAGGMTPLLDADGKPVIQK